MEDRYYQIDEADDEGCCGCAIIVLLVSAFVLGALLVRSLL